MNFYACIKPLLFLLPAEFSHHLSLRLLGISYRLGLSRLLFGKTTYAPVEVMGIQFQNRVGLAAGLDKNGDYIDALSSTGFGFIEIGTVTPKSQAGNPKPRLFRLQQASAIINRMGFNNKGVLHLVSRARSSRRLCPVGINIGKNRDTPLELAVTDYSHCFSCVYEVADYVTINLSSPNTPGLRDLQHGDYLRHIIKTLKADQKTLSDEHKKYVPLVVKIAPDLEDDEIAQLAAIFNEYRIDGVIATNTTLSREGLTETDHASEAGGLSGVPLKSLSDIVIRQLREHLDDSIPVIAVGGISSPRDAVDKLAAGASLVQLYTGFIYQGPNLVRSCAEILATVD